MFGASRSGVIVGAGRLTTLTGKMVPTGDPTGPGIHPAQFDNLQGVREVPLLKLQQMALQSLRRSPELLLLAQLALAELLDFLLDLILLRFGSHLAIVRVARRLRGAIVAAAISGVVAVM